jgi:hypothetical protein
VFGEDIASMKEQLQVPDEEIKQNDEAGIVY